MGHFDLTRDQLLEVASDLSLKIREGLRVDGRELKCLPTHLSLSDDPGDGSACVLDLGGSNVRAAIVESNGGRFSFRKGPIAEQMPWTRHVSFPRDSFLGIQADLLASLKSPDPCPLGYCFSYPAASTPDGDATLVEWTKGIEVPGMVGRKVGGALLEYLSHHGYPVRCPAVKVVNDTVASLLAGLTAGKTDLCIGLIVGTGTNMATLMKPGWIPKLRVQGAGRNPIPVNLESGNLNPPHLTRWDDMVDRNSENPGEQRFEKAVSGAYLGRIFHAACPQEDFDAQSGAEGVVHFLEKSGQVDDTYRAAEAIYGRSADLVAASLAGLIQFMAGFGPVGNVTVVAEGGLFWGKLNGKNQYRDAVDSRLQDLLSAPGLSDTRVRILRIENANLIGSAVAALA